MRLRLHYDDAVQYLYCRSLYEMQDDLTKGPSHATGSEASKACTQKNILYATQFLLPGTYLQHKYTMQSNLGE
jgi:hypothetical protein